MTAETFDYLIHLLGYFALGYWLTGLAFWLARR
jgi:hypothetical protein